MTLRNLSKQIKRRKKILNLLLLILPPTNKIIVALSQDLDKHIFKYQRHLSIKHKRKLVAYQYYKKLSA